jgi:hypothetical protein
MTVPQPGKWVLAGPVAAASYPSVTFRSWMRPPTLRLNISAP